jgi:hypothetical protein
LLVELVIPDLNPGGGALLSIISSAQGEQEDSEIKINRVIKTTDNGKFFYDLEMTVNCKLYYQPFLGTGGLYGKLENGVLRLKTKLAL